MIVTDEGDNHSYNEQFINNVTLLGLDLKWSHKA